MKLCLFIDGLDEYDGLEVDIAGLFKGVVLSPHVKVCVSSRPHVPFEDAFAARPKLRLQDLTGKDIHQFIQDRLVHDEMMKALAAREPEECQELVREIANEAQGVFLWVVLVVTSLINGLSLHDGISELQMRLKAVPKNLDELYEQMILKVDDIYKEEASRLYQLVTEATEHPGDWKAADLLSVYSLSLAAKPDLDLAEEMGQRRLNDDEIMQASKRMDVVLRTRCGGLLEIQFGKAKTTTPSPAMKVAYLHRTVRDFLKIEENWQEILKRTNGGAKKGPFKPSVAIFKSMVIQMKHLSSFTGRGLIDQALTFIKRIDTRKIVSTTEFAELFGLFYREATAGRYLDFAPDQDGDISEEGLRRPLLDYAVVTTKELELVSLLLKLGANPNERHNGFSPWQNALSRVISNYQSLGVPTLCRWGEIVKELLENGADPHAYCQGPSKFSYRGKQRRKVDNGNTWSASEVIAKAFEAIPPSSAANSARLERLRKQAVQKAKERKKIVSSTKKANSRSPSDRITPGLDPDPKNANALTDSFQMDRGNDCTSFKCGPCCFQ